MNSMEDLNQPERQGFTLEERNAIPPAPRAMLDQTSQVQRPAVNGQSWAAYGGHQQRQPPLKENIPPIIGYRKLTTDMAPANVNLQPSAHSSWNVLGNSLRNDQGPTMSQYPGAFHGGVVRPPMIPAANIQPRGFFPRQRDIPQNNMAFGNAYDGRQSENLRQANQLLPPSLQQSSLPPFAQLQPPRHSLGPIFQKESDAEIKAMERLRAFQPAMDAAVIVLIDYTTEKFRDWIVEQYNIVKTTGVNIQRMVFEFLDASTEKNTPETVEEAVGLLKKVDIWLRRNQAGATPRQQRKLDRESGRGRQRVLPDTRSGRRRGALDSIDIEVEGVTHRISAHGLRNLSSWLANASANAIKVLLDALKTCEAKVHAKDLADNAQEDRALDSFSVSVRITPKKSATALHVAINQVEAWLKDHGTRDDVSKRLQHIQTRLPVHRPALDAGFTAKDIRHPAHRPAKSGEPSVTSPSITAGVSATKSDITAKALELRSLRLARSDKEQDRLLGLISELARMMKEEPNSANTDAMYTRVQNAVNARHTLDQSIARLESQPGVLDAEKKEIPFDVVRMMHGKANHHKRHKELTELSQDRTCGFTREVLEKIARVKETIQSYESSLDRIIASRPFWRDKYIAATESQVVPDVTNGITPGRKISKQHPITNNAVAAIGRTSQVALASSFDNAEDPNKMNNLKPILTIPGVLAQPAIVPDKVFNDLTVEPSPVAKPTVGSCDMASKPQPKSDNRITNWLNQTHNPPFKDIKFEREIGLTSPTTENQLEKHERIAKWVPDPGKLQRFKESLASLVEASRKTNLKLVEAQRRSDGHAVDALSARINRQQIHMRSLRAHIQAEESELKKIAL